MDGYPNYQGFGPPTDSDGVLVLAHLSNLKLESIGKRNFW